MKTRKLIWLLPLVLLGMNSCSSDDEIEEMEQEEQQAEEETVDVSASCTPDMNSIVFNNTPISFYNVASGVYGGLIFGNWNVVANGSQGDLHMQFSSEPSTGMYATWEETSFLGQGRVILTGTLGNQHWVAESLDTVFVVNEPGNFSATFCGTTFSSPSGQITWDFTTDGNLTDVD